MYDLRIIGEGPCILTNDVSGSGLTDDVSNLVLLGCSCLIEDVSNLG